jgi:hypothetical protein
MSVFIYFIDLSDHRNVIDYAYFSRSERLIYDFGGCDKIDEFLNGKIRLFVGHDFPGRELSVNVSEHVHVFLDQVVHTLRPDLLVAEILERELFEVRQSMILKEFGDGLIESLAQAALEILLDGEADQDL